MSRLAVRVRMLAPILVFAGLVTAAPAPVAAAPTDTNLEAGLLGPAAAGERLSLIVHLTGPSVLDQMGIAPGESTAALPSAPRAQTAHDAIAAAQEPAAQAIEGLGATVVYRYQTIRNGFLVHATRGQVPAIARTPGVAEIAFAPILTPDLDAAVPHIGATKVWQDLGIDGTGATVAVIDTGIDYNHADFGGSGIVDDYNNNDPTLVEPDTFPTAKVIGGYDLAGEIYTADPACTVPPPPNAVCSPEPDPDDDPLDLHFHGTHTSGIAAGSGVPGASPGEWLVAPGVAPGAKIVSLKVFGTPDGVGVSTDLADAAVEWAADSNLGIEVPGFGGVDAIGPIRVINMSLGAGYSGGMLETERVVSKAVAAGITVVASAGNDGALPYVTGSPASASEALSVASSLPPGIASLVFDATWTDAGNDVEISDLALESGITGQTRTPPEGWGGDLAWFGRGCSADPPQQDVNERVALIERGACTFVEKLTNAEAAGAIAAVVFTDNRSPTTMGGTAAIQIPAVMIRRSWGLQMVEALDVKGLDVSFRVQAAEEDLLADTISGFSSRGPARLSGGLKPQITAPGSSIRSALVGSGTSAAPASGTSMSGPMVAGVAALLWQRNLDQGLGLDALDIGALAMNYARPAVRSWRNDTGNFMPVARQGAGRVDAARSATAMTVVRSPGGIAEVGLGNIHIAYGRALVTRTLTVRNLAATEKTYASEFQFAFPGEDEGQGVDVDLVPATLTVPGGAVGMLGVKVTLAADDVRPYSLPPVNPIANEAAFQAMEVDGYVAITEVDSSRQPVPEGDQVVVPFHTWPVHDSCVKLENGDPIDLTAGGDPGELRWTNDCSAEGQAAVFAEVGTDPEEEANPGKLNITSVAARIGPSPDLSSPGCRTLLEWAITTSGPRRIAYDTEFRVFIDTDDDSALDTVIWNFYGPELSSDAGISLPAGTWWVGHAPLKVDADTDRPLPEPDEVAMGHDILPLPFRVDERVATLPVCWDNLGIKGPSRSEKFDFAVSAADYTEDYPVSDDYLGYDLAPSDMEDGGRFTFDRGAVGCIRVVDGDGNVVNAPGTSALVPGNGEASAKVTSSCGGEGLGKEVRLVSAAVSNEPTGNPLAWRGATIGVASVWLPYVSNRSVLVLPPEPTAAPPEPTAVPPEPTAAPPEPTAVPPEPTQAP